MKIKLIMVLGIAAVALTIPADTIQVGGIGVAISRSRDGEPLRVALVLPGSPAQAAGVRTNWFLISVNGTNVAGIPSTDCMNMVHGPAGTSVTLELTDPITRQTKTHTIKRADVRVPDELFRSTSPTNAGKPLLIAR
jgi:C-terminal processing protease CtpA/Prc